MNQPEQGQSNWYGSRHDSGRRRDPHGGCVGAWVGGLDTVLLLVQIQAHVELDGRGGARKTNPDVYFGRFVPEANPIVYGRLVSFVSLVGRGYGQQNERKRRTEPTKQPSKQRHSTRTKFHHFVRMGTVIKSTSRRVASCSCLVRGASGEKRIPRFHGPTWMYGRMHGEFFTLPLFWH